MHALSTRVPWFPVFLIVAGTGMLLQRLNIVHIDWHTVVWSLITLFGATTLTRGVFDRRKGGVFWGLLLFSAGAFGLLREFDVVDPGPGIVAAGALLSCGLACLMIVLVAPRAWHVLVPAIFFLSVGGLVLTVELGYLEPSDVLPFLATLWPVALVLFGAALILNRERRA